MPKDNIREASLVKGLNVFGFEKLTEVLDFLTQITPYKTLQEYKTEHTIERPYLVDFQDVHGQDAVLEYIVATAAGGHNMLMSGPPGCGKSMIAKRIPTILPDMEEEEALEVTKIYSVCGLLRNRGMLITNRPFRAPHHNASTNSLVGGGTKAAHRGSQSYNF